MNIHEAFEIVLDLAANNIITDPDFEEETERQEEALKMVTDHWTELKP